MTKKKTRKSAEEIDNGNFDLKTDSDAIISGADVIVRAEGQKPKAPEPNVSTTPKTIERMRQESKDVPLKIRAGTNTPPKSNDLNKAPANQDLPRGGDKFSLNFDMEANSFSIKKVETKR